MKESENSFRNRVHLLVGSIPPKRVMTYGQIAAMAGNPRAARIVGGIAHYGDPSLPWQRVVKKDGGLAEGFPGGITGHSHALEAEGVRVEAGKIDIGKYLWRP